MVMMGYTMSRAAIIATALAILVSMPNKETRMNPTRFINALEAGGKNTLSVAVACGVAGIIAGVVTMTGLGQLLISAIVGVAGDRVIVALFLTRSFFMMVGMIPKFGHDVFCGMILYSCPMISPSKVIAVTFEGLCFVYNRIYRTFLLFVFNWFGVLFVDTLFKVVFVPFKRIFCQFRYIVTLQE